VICGKHALGLSLAVSIFVASLVPQSEAQRCVLCATMISQNFDRDDSSHRQFSTDHVGFGDLSATGGTSSSGNVTVTPGTALLRVTTFAPTAAAAVSS
jgi:hypothetical protein